MVNRPTLQSKNSVTPAELHALCHGGNTEILDVRTLGEFAAAHIPGAVPSPLHTLNAAAHLNARIDRSKPVYVVCQSGGRAGQAIQQFQDAGFHGCVLLEGGTQAWIDAGLPVVKGESRTLPLMRQVQIVVGILSGAGAALALGIHPGFAVLPLLTGCGLLFAGLTGKCGLALLLAKMPWNNAATCNTKTCCGGEA
jgi:rhodanese-related sulfurtransferase